MRTYQAEFSNKETYLKKWYIVEADNIEMALAKLAPFTDQNDTITGLHETATRIIR